LTRAVGRRALLGGIATFPLIAVVSSPPLLAACGGRPETPLAHLYGKDWVHGAYRMYATKYAGVQTSADASSRDAYRVLAQKGIVALDRLQTREVPFFIKVDDDAKKFRIHRKVPERLTFTADMNDADRQLAEASWKRAREHIHTDYEECRRLDWALTRLLEQLQRIRNAIEEGQIEQYRLVAQLIELRKDPKSLPYELPYQVTPKDYEEILLLLVERLDADRARLQMMEADVVAVGMTARSTDANSATLAASIRKVLLAVLEDGAVKPRPPEFPANDEERAKYLAAGRARMREIEASPEFARWQHEERERALAALGAFLAALDAMTGLPTSQIYRTVLDIWSGDHDYLGYLKTIAGFVPRAGAVMKVITDAIEYTDEARQVAGTVMATVQTVARADLDALAAQAKSRAITEAKGVVLNTASRFALERADKQLAYFKDRLEVDRVKDLLEQTELVRDRIESLPAP
jgi:hypothetical protein